MKITFLRMIELMFLCSVCGSVFAAHHSPSHINQKQPKSMDIVVVGAGGAGLSAAIQAAREGEKVIVLEKTSKIGGNTQYASGGINAAGSRYQRKLGIKDSPALLYQDTMKAGRGLNDPKLVKLLAEKSVESLNWLVDMGADLSFVGRMGGSGVNRAHRPSSEIPVGVEIMRVLQKTADQLKVVIQTNSDVVKLLSKNDRIIGVEVKKQDDRIKTIYANAVILAAGGFGANSKMVSRYEPVLKEFRTTNYSGATGDGIKLAQSVHAELVNMNNIQLHPTVSVKHPVLITEALRGLGAILVNQQAERFVNELQTRDVVSQVEMRQTGKKAFLIFDQQVADKFSAAVKFYKEKEVLVHALCTRQNSYPPLIVKML